MTVLQIYLFGAAAYFVFAAWRVVQTDREKPSPFSTIFVGAVLAGVTVFWPIVLPFTIARCVRDWNSK